ncbi:MAG: hydrogenase maturation nickel metallochaperone HypA [Bacillota bacterium]|nr:hydrogenase maturation nickel metallochaperone HypA [Bacillota bacterium]
MHETALIQNLIVVAQKTLEEHNVKRVNSVTLSVGKLSNAMPDALSFAFEAMTQRGSLKGAKLIMKEIPVTVCCLDCGAEYNPLNFPIICPKCNSIYYKITQGEDIFIESLDCEF